MYEKLPFVSVIIPVFNHCVSLRSCLYALTHQTYPQELYEIVVIDNNSNEDIASVTQSFRPLKLSFEATPGSYSARNKGISIARGQVLGFTDADCIPDPDWIQKGVQRLSEAPDCGLVAGRINFFFENPERPTVAELFDSQTFLNQKKYIETENYGATANVFTFREVFDKVGLFNTQLKSGGDREWGKRVHAAGYRLVYADDVRIAHPARHSIKALKTKVLRVTEGQYTSDSSSKPLIPAFSEFLKDAKPYLGYAVEVLTDKRTRNFGYKLGLIRTHIILRYARAWKKFQLNFQKQ